MTYMLRRMNPSLLTLLACTQPVVDTVVAPDEPSLLPELPACTGADYDFDAWREPYPSNPWWFVRTSVGDFLPPRVALERSSGDRGCPTLEAEGDRETFSGDCEADGVSFAGEWTHEDTVDELTSLSVVVDDWMLSGNGRFKWEYDDHTYVVEADGAYERGLGNDLDGAFVFEDLRFEWTAKELLGAGRVSVDWTYGRGSYCLTAEVFAAEDCPSQADGYWAIQGVQTFTYVPTGCDGCIEVYRDGAFVRTACDVGDLLR